MMRSWLTRRCNTATVFLVLMGVLTRNAEKTTKIVTRLELKIPTRDLKSKDSRYVLSLILSQWLPLPTCIIQAVIDVVPAPSIAQATRIPNMLDPELFEATVKPKNKLEMDLFTANSNSSAAISAFVSKIFVVSAKDLPENKKKPLTAEEMRAKTREKRTQSDYLGQEAAPSDPGGQQDYTSSCTADSGEVVLGFARLYSGTIRTGIGIYCVLPKYNNSLGPTHPHNLKHLVVARVEGLYVMMGRELVAVGCVPAGNIFAIRGLEGRVWRSATLCAPSSDGLGNETPQAPMQGYLLNLGGLDRNVSLPIASPMGIMSLPTDRSHPLFEWPSSQACLLTCLS